MTYSDDELNSDRAMRSSGWRTFGVGIVLGFIFIGAPLQQAINQEDEVRLTFVGVLVSILALILGLIMIVAGRKARHVIDFRDENTTLLNLLMSIVIFAAAVGGAIGFEYYLESYGYDF